METILWFLIFISNFIAGVLALYFYLLHEDFHQQKMTSFELTSILNKYIPIEISIQLLVTIVSCIYGHYFLLLCYLPLASYNMFILVKKKYRVYGFTMSEYWNQSFQFQAQMKYKSIYYFILCLSIGFCFAKAFLRMSIYRYDVIIDYLTS